MIRKDGLILLQCKLYGISLLRLVHASFWKEKGERKHNLSCNLHVLKYWRETRLSTQVNLTRKIKLAKYVHSSRLRKFATVFERRKRSKK